MLLRKITDGEISVIYCKRCKRTNNQILIRRCVFCFSMFSGHTLLHFFSVFHFLRVVRIRESTINLMGADRENLDTVVYRDVSGCHRKKKKKRKESRKKRAPSRKEKKQYRTIGRKVSHVIRENELYRNWKNRELDVIILMCQIAFSRTGGLWRYDVPSGSRVGRVGSTWKTR